MGLAHKILFLCHRTILWLGSVAPLAGLPTCILTISTPRSLELPPSLPAPHPNMGDASLALPLTMPTWHFGAPGPAARAPGRIEHHTKHYTGTPGPSPRVPVPTNTLLAPGPTYGLTWLTSPQRPGCMLHQNTTLTSHTPSRPLSPAPHKKNFPQSAPTTDDIPV